MRGENDDPPLHNGLPEAPEVASADAFGAEQPDAMRARVLGEIALNVSEARRLRTQLDEHVAQARELGVSWRAVGAAAGMHPTVALRRWDPIARDKQRLRERAARRRQRGSQPGDVEEG